MARLRGKKGYSAEHNGNRVSSEQLREYKFEGIPFGQFEKSLFLNSIGEVLMTGIDVFLLV